VEGLSACLDGDAVAGLGEICNCHAAFYGDAELFRVFGEQLLNAFETDHAARGSGAGRDVFLIGEVDFVGVEHNAGKMAGEAGSGGRRIAHFHAASVCRVHPGERGPAHIRKHAAAIECLDGGGS
jgi:hypothetical protein